jgi:hypothetical protein
MTTSEGEQFIEEYFKHQGIRFRKQETLDGLKEDSKSHRVADFYLPKYKVYVEYYGQWNMDSEKNRYREKKQVYLKNHIPCVILYPENLGIIEFIFPKRMLDVMNRYKLEKELKRYKWKMMLEQSQFRPVLIILTLVLIAYYYPWKDKMWLTVGLGLIIYQLYFFTKEYQKLFKKEQLLIEYFER